MKTIELLKIVRQNLEQNENLGGTTPIIINKPNPTRDENGLCTVDENNAKLSFIVMDKNEKGNIRKRFLITIKDINV